MKLGSFTRRKEVGFAAAGLILLLAPTALSVYSATATGTSVLKVTTQVNGGGSIAGFYTVVMLKNGNTVATGYTPAHFVLNDSQTYFVEVQGFGSYYFQYWKGSGSVSVERKVTINGNQTATAVMCNGPPGTCPDPVPKNGVNVYAHRIPASYWAPCFATVCSLGTGPGASMYFVLTDSSGKVLKSGFANEQGMTFTGLTPGVTYYVYPEDCDLCHGSTHDVVFQYWGDNVSSVRPLAVTVGASLDAWYSCTNGCA